MTRLSPEERDQFAALDVTDEQIRDDATELSRCLNERDAAGLTDLHIHVSQSERNLVTVVLAHTHRFLDAPSEVKGRLMAESAKRYERAVTLRKRVEERLHTYLNDDGDWAR